MNYHISDGVNQRGPFPVEQLLANGLRPEWLVWRDGMPQWTRADQTPELAGLFPAPASPPPGAGFPGQYPPGGYPPGAYPPGAYPPGAYPPPGSGPQYQGYPPYGYAPPNNSNKIAAGVCGILLGGLGVHKFVIGATGAGVIMLLVTLLTCGWGGIIMGPIGLIEGIIYLTKNDEEFYHTYTLGKKSWF